MRRAPFSACCIGDGHGNHHPMCAERSRGIEVRGFIAMNGRRELCFFPHSGAEGVPLSRWDDVAEAMFAAPARRVAYTDLVALDPPRQED